MGIENGKSSLEKEIKPRRKVLGLIAEKFQTESNRP